MSFKDQMAKMKLAAKFNGSMGPLALTSDKLRYEFKSYPVAGAVAEIDTVEAPAPQTTLTRIAAGAVIAGPVGAIIGGMLKKDKARGYVTVTLADGKILLTTFPAPKLVQAKYFIGLINEASAHYSS